MEESVLLLDKALPPRENARVRKLKHSKHSKPPRLLHQSLIATPPLYHLLAADLGIQLEHQWADIRWTFIASSV